MDELVKKINAQYTAIANEMDSAFKSFNSLTSTLRHMEQAMMQDIQ